MGKIAGYIVLVVCMAIYLLSSSQKLTTSLSTYKFSADAVIRSDRYRYGDLYGLSYLPYFRTHAVHEKPVKPVDCGYRNQIDLYEICDSYLWSFVNSAGFYCGVNRFVSVKTNILEKLSVKLDTSKINVLLVEFSERNLRMILNDTLYIKNLLEENSTETVITIHDPLLQHDSTASSFKKIISGMEDYLFNKKINTNIESNLWDNSFFTPVKELKASINYKLFHAVNKEVNLSKNGRQLFYNVTIDTVNTMSSFKYVPETEMEIMLGGLQKIYSKAIQIGFNKVYLSIIPNPVSIIEPDYGGLTPNHLVERIQHSPLLPMPYIDLIPVFTRMKNSVYYPADTHWNMTGTNVWLDQFNAELAKTIREQEHAVKK